MLDYKLETVTPAIATRYLESNATNRPLIQSWIDALATAIKNGRWRVSHQGLAFDLDGRLVDGQHRCWAVVLSNEPVKMMVARGLTADDVAVIDTGRGRSYRDHAHYQGWKAEPATSGVIKWLVQGPGDRARVVPASVLHAWYEFYAEGIEYALQARRTARVQGKRLTSPMLAALARGYFALAEPVMDRFVSALATGQREFEADNAAIVLRDAWLAGRLGTMSEQHYKTQGAIRAFSERRAIRTLQRTAGDVLPIPKLPKDLRYESTQTARRRTSMQQQRAERTPPA